MLQVLGFELLIPCYPTKACYQLSLNAIISCLSRQAVNIDSFSQTSVNEEMNCGSLQSRISSNTKPTLLNEMRRRGGLRTEQQVEMPLEGASQLVAWFREEPEIFFFSRHSNPSFLRILHIQIQIALERGGSSFEAIEWKRFRSATKSCSLAG